MLSNEGYETNLQQRHEPTVDKDSSMLLHFRTTLFITGAFVVAWSWDLVVYAFSHVWFGEDPLYDHPLAFGNQHAPKNLWILVLQYVFVCGGAAILSNSVRRRKETIQTTTSTSTTDYGYDNNYHHYNNNNNNNNDQGWIEATTMAIEFFPSPIFAGKLMSYLMQFYPSMSPLSQALLNLLATGFAAFVAQVALGMTSSTTSSTTSSSSSSSVSVWQRMGWIIRDTLGFGLGIAWNVLFQELGPSMEEDSNGNDNDGDSDNQGRILHIVALACYLGMISVLALKLAAMEAEYQHQRKTRNDNHNNNNSRNDNDDTSISVAERCISLLAFAMYVVCGFTLVHFCTILWTPSVPFGGWILSSLFTFVIVLTLATIASSMVAAADLDGMLDATPVEIDKDDPTFTSFDGGGVATAERRTTKTSTSSTSASTSWKYNSSKFGAFGGILNCCLFVPCVWCCCPWIPVLILLAGMTESVGVKEHWYQLIAMVAGLASSIEGSSMLSSTTASMAQILGICGHKHCKLPWMYVLLQFGLAILCTIVLLPMIAPLSPKKMNTNYAVRSGVEDSTNDLFLATEGSFPSSSTPFVPKEYYDPLLPPNNAEPRSTIPSHSHNNPPSQNPNYDPHRM